MKKIGFIGACDKINIITYVAKMLTYLDNKVMIVDTTYTQKYKYTAPSINSAKAYITNYEGIDFAIGVKNIRDIKRYFGIKDEMSDDNLEYDYMLIDIDDSNVLNEFGIQNSEDNFFITTFDMYSLQKGTEILKEIEEPIKLSKVFYNYNTRSDDEKYFDYLVLETKVTWNEYTIYIPIYQQDNQILDENQRVYKIALKKLSANFQDTILCIVQNIIKESNIGKLRKSIKE